MGVLKKGWGGGGGVGMSKLLKFNEQARQNKRGEGSNFECESTLLWSLFLEVDLYYPTTTLIKKIFGLLNFG